MKRERIDIKPGDMIRCPDRATAAWHRVVRVGRHQSGGRYITLRRGRVWRLLGLPAMQRIEWSLFKALGYGLKRARGSTEATIPAAAATKTSPEEAA